jgi:uncharacterized protein YjbJ (UPF0337 family)
VLAISLLSWLAAAMRFGRLPNINEQESDMGINKDQVDGRVKEASGKIQEEFGKLTGNKTQQVKGAINKTVGAGQAKLGDLAERAKGTGRKP